MSDLPPLLPRSPHGGPSSTTFSGVDFSVNSNPYGPNPVLLEAVRNADHAHYPDPTYRGVRRVLADWHDVSPEMVAPSVGASDLLHRLARAFLPAGSLLLSLHAPFGELERAARLQRAEITVQDVLSVQPPAGTRLVYVGQPHNPTGHSLSAAELENLAEACAQAGAVLVLDLAYAPFVTVPVVTHPSCVLLHSPGKVHGLVGARPAYAIAAPEITARLENLAPAWHLPAGTAALLERLSQAQEFLQETLPVIQQNAWQLAAALRDFGEVQHHGTPYMTLEVGDAAAVAQALLAHGVKVRDCTSYGLPARIRVSTRLPEENTMLIHALQHVLPHASQAARP